MKSSWKKWVAAAVSCLCVAGAGAKEIVIGQVAPFSGPGAQTYIASVNAKGGVNGNKIKLVTRDDGYKVEETVRLTKEILAKEQPTALIGIVGTGNNEALLKQKILSDAGIALVGVRSGATSLHEPFNPWIF